MAGWPKRTMARRWCETLFPHAASVIGERRYAAQYAAKIHTALTEHECPGLHHPMVPDSSGGYGNVREWPGTGGAGNVGRAAKCGKAVPGT